MGRWIAVAAVLLLAGCASTRDYYYDDGYYSRDRYAYDHGYGDRYVGDSYYHRSRADHGDYWYAEPSYRYPGYFDTPYYYSLFWPINRWYYDPFWYPGYHYGVTFFPRNYLSFSFGWGHGWGHGWGRWNHFAYSPYRYGWSDWAYDWYPWYRAYPNYAGYYGRPRFGDARNEAERLARLSNAHRSYTQRSSALVGGRGLPMAGRGDGLRSARAESRTLPSRGMPATSARDALPSRSRANTSRSEGRAVPRSAPRASLREAQSLRDSRADASYGRADSRARIAAGEYARPARGAAVREPLDRPLIDRDSPYRERNHVRALPQRGTAMPERRMDLAPQRGYASRGSERLPAREPARALRGYERGDERGYDPEPRQAARAPVLRGGYEVGARAAPAMGSPGLPSRSVAAPAPRARSAERSAPPARSAPVASERSGRGRGGEDER